MTEQRDYGDALEPDYDTAAQADFVLQLVILSQKFNRDVWALAEKYVRDREKELTRE